MAFFENYNFENLKNEAERVVLDELERQLASYPIDICKCNDCIVDMAAMALNSVKPFYRCSLLGSLYAAEVTGNEGYKKSLSKAVKLAIEKISVNPSHS